MTEPFTPEYWEDRARVVLPSATDAEIQHAATVLAGFYSTPVATYEIEGATLPTWEYAPGKITPSTEAEDPRDVKPRTIGAPYGTLSPRGIVGGLMVDASAFNGLAGGGAPDMPRLPDAWSAHQHTMGRDVSGNEIVKTRGRARVQGAPFGTCLTTPSGMTGALLGQMLEDLPRNSVGAIGYQVQALTDIAFPGLPRVFDDLTEPDSQLNRAMHAPGLLRGVCGQHSADETEGKVYWPARVRLPRVRARKSEPVTAVSLIAPADRTDRVFIGHKLVTRGKLARVARRGKRAARTVQLVAVAIDSPLALATAAECMNRGERVAVTFNGVAVTVTRGKAGLWSITTPSGSVSGLRTPANVGKRVATLTGA